MFSDDARVQPIQTPAYKYQVVYEREYLTGPQRGQRVPASLEYVEEEDARRVFGFYHAEVVTDTEGNEYRVLMQEVRPL